MRVGCQWFRQIELRISTVLDLPQSFKVPQKYVTQPLGVHTWDPPLLCLLVFQPTWPDGIDRGILTIITKNRQIEFPEFTKPNNYFWFSLYKKTLYFRFSTQKNF